MKRNFRKLPGACWLGANFWSRNGGPLMWREPYDPAILRAELRTLREHGLNTTRSFFYWPDFMPEPDRIDEDCVARYQDFLDAHQELGMGTIPTFIVGHMSGENWDPIWREGRDLYGDVWLVGRQAWFAEQLTRRFHAHPAVAGWLITNEMPIYGGTAERRVISAWAQLMVQAVRAGGGTQPVSIGDGAWGAEVTGEHNGFSTRDLAVFTDFVGPHVYRMEDDVVRQHYAAAFVCELTGGFDRPVVLEEFGVTSEYVAGDHAAHYYRQVLYNSLLAGATGWLAWNNTDFDLTDQDPYRHHPFELHFGLTTVEGTPKPQLAEMADFARTLREIDVERCERVNGDAVLVVPEVMEGDVPFTYPEERTHIFTTLRQAYVAARAADLPIGLTRERDGIAGGARLYLVPSTKQLTAPGWHRLEALAEQGAVVYVSYSPGTPGIQRGPWYSHMNAMFGVEHRLRYGLIDPVEDDVVELTFLSGLGSIDEGTTLAFNAAGNEHSRAYLPVRPVEAEVVAVDQHGTPALLRRRAGAGWLILGTFPIEHMAALTPRVNPEPTYRLYDALAGLAGVSRPVTVDDPRVSVDLLEHDNGTRYAFLVSQSEERLTVKPAGLDEAITLPPYGVRVISV
ncbi:cellulase family glycosylhydrolase [Nonomuraea sp. NPDC050536]|uniref:glycoside hydrolase 5 family protein n=1 Tax=Nonomuraea sp. NPDC050536 TaxID=3364366 RepID=UPI0037C59089